MDATGFQSANNLMDTMMMFIPLLFILVLTMVVVGMFNGDGDMFSSFGYSIRRYWWMIPLLLFPIFLVFGFGFDWGLIIGMLVLFTVGGAVVFYFLENDFEMPKGDPIKQGIKWLRKNFRW